MQLDLFLAVLAAVLVRDVALIAAQRTLVWFSLRRLAKMSEAPDSITPFSRGMFRPPAPLTPDEMESLAQKCRGLELEGMSDSMVDELGRRCMQERSRRIPHHESA